MSQAAAPRRAVILGASNVFRSVSTVAATAKAAWGAPLELLIAAGHGRSYGAWNRVLGYSVPGIVQCGIWDAINARQGVPTAALVTDAGNDLLYGASPETILNWIETCLSRLRPVCQRIAITRLPIARLERLRPIEFVLFRHILFPRSRLSYTDAIAQARCLDEGLVQLAEKFSACLVTPELDWYGFDPIHIRRRDVVHAWRTVLTSWSDDELAASAHLNLRKWWSIRRHRTHVQRFLGREYLTPQPVVHDADGSTISLF